jgi:hypothetical protein
VHILQVGNREKAFGYTSLVRYYNYRVSGSFQQRDGVRDPRKNVEVIPGRDVLALPGFPVDNSIAIYKNCFAHCGLHSGQL